MLLRKPSKKGLMPSFGLLKESLRVIPLGPVRGRALGVEDDGVAVLVFVEGEVCCSRSKR